MLPLPLWRAIQAADRGKCIWCGITRTLQVDHCMPRAAGGTDAPRNLFTLCKQDNTIKSNYWKARGSYVHYRPFDGYSNRRLARRILRREKLLRWWPPRMLRLRAALREAGL
jgi:5-methylcytosine-specific restriction endonuclease McrA